MSVLADRLAQPDMVDLSAAEAAAVLLAPDPALPAVLAPFSCRAIAEPAVLSGELAMLLIVAERGCIPADVSPTGADIPVPTPGLVAIRTMLHAVERDLRVDPATPGASAQIAAMFDAVEQLGLLSAQTKAAVLAGTARSPSWAEAHGVYVDAAVVALARASAATVTLLGWEPAGLAPGGQVYEAARLRFADGREEAPLFKLPVANSPVLRAAALMQWATANAYVLH